MRRQRQRRSTAAQASYVLGIDGGQTTTRGAVCDLHGRVVARAEAGAWDHMSSAAGRRRCRAALRGILDDLLPTAGRSSCRVVCLGLTSGTMGTALINQWVRERLRAADVMVVPDVVSNLRGADPSGRPGVVVIAGGGSIAWGHTPDGREAFAGGHGYLLDDEGSGYEIGRQAIIAVLKAAHGRRPPTVLTGFVLRHFGTTDVWTVRGAFYSGRAGRHDVAGLVPAVAEAAKAGDGAARMVLTSGARALAEMAGAVIGRLNEPDIAVYPTGGVFRAGPLILEPFTESLRATHPRARVIAPMLSPLGGVLVLALERAGSLRSEVIRRLAATLGHTA